ncbi:MAG: hypothetical protein O2968_17195 [Acidobacteria bacterium]|nr:hypothetical protein [Acidobacteriota bacterium]
MTRTIAVCALALLSNIVGAGQTLEALALKVTPNLRLILPEQANEKRIIRPGDTLLPQAANGELAGGQAFFTFWEALNITSSTASFEVRFFDSNGSPMTVPIANPMNPTDFQNPLQAIGFGGTLPPGASGGQLTIPFNAPVQIGYAAVTATPLESVAVIGVFNNLVPGERAYQASIPSIFQSKNDPEMR